MRIPFSLISYITGIFVSLLIFYSGDKPQTCPNLNLRFSDFFKSAQHIPEKKINKHIEFNTVSEIPQLIPDHDKNTYSIPIMRTGRIFVIDATIDGETGKLIFDTGATSLVLNRTYFRDHVKTGEIASSGITGNLSQVDRVAINELAIGEMKFQRISAHLADLGHIENKRGIKVFGLFGFELIKSFEINLDIENNALILRRIDTKGNLLETGKQFRADLTQKVEIANNVLFIKAIIAEKNLRFCFDTGAETNALNSDLHKTILQTVSITRTVKLKGAGSSSTEVIYGHLNNFQIGDTLINNMETIITYMDHLNEAYGIHIDGVLGFDFISKANFCINFVKKQMEISYINPVRL